MTPLKAFLDESEKEAAECWSVPPDPAMCHQCRAKVLIALVREAVEALEEIHVPHVDGAFCRKQYEAGAKCCPACVSKMALASMAALVAK